jgi:hypothetical protein
LAKKRYTIGDVIDLDDVNISPAAFAAWHTVAMAGAQALGAAGLVTDPSQIPDEQGLWLATGELEIFVEVGNVRVSMKIPPDQWAWRQ